jgi:hypothetical protein
MRKIHIDELRNFYSSPLTRRILVIKYKQMVFAENIVKKTKIRTMHKVLAGKLQGKYGAWLCGRGPYNIKTVLKGMCEDVSWIQLTYI